MEERRLPGITVRPLTREDAKTVVVLGWELLHYHAGISKWIVPVRSFECFAEAWRPYLDRFVGVDGRLALVAEVGGGLAGYLLACLRDLPPILDGPPELLVTEVMVVPRNRGAGVGGALMRAAYDWGRRRGCLVARVNVYEPNEGAIGFYEREGFATHERVMLKRIADM